MRVAGRWAISGRECPKKPHAEQQFQKRPCEDPRSFTSSCETRHHFFGASWIGFSVMPGENLWDLEPKKGSRLVADTWCDGAHTLEQKGLKVNWNDEEVDIPSGVGGAVQPSESFTFPGDLRGAVGWRDSSWWNRTYLHCQPLDSCEPCKSDWTWKTIETRCCSAVLVEKQTCARWKVDTR